MSNQNPDLGLPRVLAVLLLAMLPAACMRAGPDYVRPVQKMPEQFFESGPWKQAAPNDASLRGKWWELFGDPVLDRLEEQARAASPRLQAAAARVRQARAALGLSEAGSLPTLEVAPEITRYAVSRNRPDQPDKVPNNREYATSRFRLPLVAAYELDLWGRVARQNESAGKRLEAGVAAYQMVLLALQGDLAQTYFQLRAADAELALLKPSAVLVNTARGGIVDLDAVHDHLKSGHLAAAGIDVVAVEPPAEPLPRLIAAFRAREPWLTGRFVLTPHAAYWSPQAEHDTRVKAAATMREALLSNRPQNVITPEMD